MVRERSRSRRHVGEVRGAWNRQLLILRGFIRFIIFSNRMSAKRKILFKAIGTQEHEKSTKKCTKIPAYFHATT